jgi:ribosome-associated translation inhibitor RaiA
MLVQVNTDNHVKVSENFGWEIDALVNDKLSRFGDQITRVEVHLSDENSTKNGERDKRCLMEARLEGMDPIVVTEKNDTVMQAINGAISRMKAAIENARGKAQAH